MKYYYNHFLFGYYSYHESESFKSIFEAAKADAIDAVNFDSIDEGGEVIFPIYRNLDDVVCNIRVKRGLFGRHYILAETENNACLIRKEIL